MKKRLLILLTLILCVSLAACNLAPPAHSDSSDNSGSSESTESSDPNLSEKIYFPLEKESPTIDRKHIPSDPNYDIKIMYGGTIKDSYIEPRPYRTIEDVSDPTEYTIKLGQKEIQAYHFQNALSDENIVEHFFISTDNSTVYRLYKGQPCLFTMFPEDNDDVLAHYENNVLSEFLMLDFLKSYISSFVDMSDFDDYYTYSCTTRINSPQSSNEDRVGFYVSEDLTDEERIVHYQFRFTKYCNGFPTTESISVTCSPEGDIELFTYSERSVDWNKYAVFTKPEQQDRIKKLIADYLPKAMKEPWTLKSMEPGEIKMVFDDGEIQLFMFYKIEIEKKGVSRSDSWSIVVEIK